MVNEEQRRSFESYVRDRFAPVLDALADRLGVRIEIRGADGCLISPRSGTDDDAGAPEGLRLSIDAYDETLGFLHSDASDDPTIELLAAMHEQMTARFVAEHDLARMTECLAQTYDKLDLLHRLAQTTTVDHDLVGACRRLLAHAAEHLEVRTLVLFLSDRWTVELATARGREPDPIVLRLTRNHDEMGVILERLRKAAGTSDHARDMGEIDLPAGPISYAVVPVHGRRGLIGFVGVLASASEIFPETDEIHLMECLGAQITDAVTNHDLYDELKNMLFNTVRSLVAAIDAKDPYTRGHSERVYRLASRIGQRMGLSAQDLQDLSWSALLHDVGKIGIPEAVLCKPGRLTPEEFDVIKSHPVRGCEMLAPIPQLRTILPGVRNHHERFDGRGYPDGLEGEEISLMARIISVADTFDAMISTRSYRDARSFSVTVDEIRSNAGTQLDPTVVKAFLELVNMGMVDVPDASESDQAERDAA